jgi:hypothetical protein
MPAEVVGVEDVLKGLQFYDDDMYERIKATISPLMRDVEAAAKSEAPSEGEMLSGWTKQFGIIGPMKYRAFPKYNIESVKGGIGYKEGKNRKFKNGFQVENYVYNVSAAGRIYETAGRVNPQGRAPFTSIHESGGVVAYEKERTRKSRSRATRSYNSNNPFAGYQFVSKLEPLTAQPKLPGMRSGGRKTKGRLIYKAWAKKSPGVYAAIVKTINTKAIDFNKATEVKAA